MNGEWLRHMKREAARKLGIRQDTNIHVPVHYTLKKNGDC